MCNRAGMSAFANNEEPTDADLILVHSGPPDWLLTDRELHGRTAVWFHNHPSLTATNQFQLAALLGSERCFVPPQSHAVLFPEYKGFRLLRCPVVLDVGPRPMPVDRIRAVIGVSRTGGRGELWDKGYEATIDILKRVRARYPNDFEFECHAFLPRAKHQALLLEANIVLDGLSNPGYSRVHLEACGLGRVALNTMHPDVERIFRAFSGDQIPWGTCRIEQLEETLVSRIRNGPETLVASAQRAKSWFDRCWTESVIADEHRRAYERLMDPVQK